MCDSTLVAITGDDAVNSAGYITVPAYGNGTIGFYLKLTGPSSGQVGVCNFVRPCAARPAACWCSPVILPVVDAYSHLTRYTMLFCSATEHPASSMRHLPSAHACRSPGSCLSARTLVARRHVHLARSACVGTAWARTVGHAAQSAARPCSEELTCDATASGRLQDKLLARAAPALSGGVRQAHSLRQVVSVLAPAARWPGAAVTSGQRCPWPSRVWCKYHRAPARHPPA